MLPLPKDSINWLANTPPKNELKQLPIINKTVTMAASPAKIL
jgi:hypothetical protein